MLSVIQHAVKLTNGTIECKANDNAMEHNHHRQNAKINALERGGAPCDAHNDLRTSSVIRKSDANCVHRRYTTRTRPSAQNIKCKEAECAQQWPGNGTWSGSDGIRSPPTIAICCGHSHE